MTNFGGNTARLARPYARAAFDYAQENQQIEQWAKLLKTLAESAAAPAIKEILKNPQYSSEKRCEVVLALGKEILDKSAENFIKVLAANHRLALLPEIYQLFEQLRTAIEKTLQVQVKSAVTLSEAHLVTLTATLKKQFGRDVAIEQTQDPSLLGGFMVYAGDQVIDNSIRGRLESLRNAVVG
jgi:F-type H+-transporting ATPase subunit delta